MSGEGPAPLVEGTIVSVGAADGTTRDVLVGAVRRRHWSVVAAGESQGERVFVKQFLDRRGRPRPEVFRSEAHGMEVAARLLPMFRIPGRVGADDQQLLTAYEFVEFDSPDELLRADPARLEAAWPSVCGAAVDLMEACAAVDLTHEPGLTVKSRPYARGAPVLQFKGLELRSMGIPRDGGPFILYDLGFPFAGPAEDLAAALLVSAAWLNWGRPLRRFLTGFPEPLVATLADRLAPWLGADAVSAEARREYRSRVRDRQAANAAAGALRAAGLGIVGRRYMKRFERWSEANVG